MIARLGWSLLRAGWIAAGFKHQGDPDRQQDHGDDAGKRDRVEQG